LEEQAVLTRHWIANFGDPVARSADLDNVLLDCGTSEQSCLRRIILLALPLLFRGTPSEVRLMFASLSMCEVGAIVLVYRKAESAFEASNVVLEEVRVLVKVDGLERELPETFAAVCIGRGLGCDTATAELGACAILDELASCPLTWASGRLLDSPSASRY
jgi:hypothetical protein